MAGMTAAAIGLVKIGMQEKCDAGTLTNPPDPFCRTEKGKDGMELVQGIMQRERAAHVPTERSQGLDANRPAHVDAEIHLAQPVCATREKTMRKMNRNQ